MLFFSIRLKCHGQRLGGLQSMDLQKKLDMTEATEHACICLCIYIVYVYVYMHTK